MDANRQWWGKEIGVFAGLWVTLLGIALLVRAGVPALPFLLLIGLPQTVVAYRALPFALFFALFETFVGGHGHLIDASLGGIPVSLRMALYGGLLLGWGVGLVMKRHSLPRWRASLWPWALMLLAVSWGTVQGVLSDAPLSLVLDDANSYFALALIFPALSLTWDRAFRRQLLLTLVAATIVLSGETLLQLFANTHFSGKMLDPLYRFVRDTRMFEVTLIHSDPISATLPSGHWYFRVFGYGQIIGAALLGYVFAWWVERGRGKTVFVVAFAGFSCLFLSLSRSFMLGFVGALVATVAWLLCTRQSSFRALFSAIPKATLAAVTALAVAWLLIVVPPRPDIRNWPFYHPELGNTRGTAVSSRWNLLPPLYEQIKQAPVLGSGFGDTVTYVSDDPRMLEEYPDGIVTTSRVEWGYHDIVWKMGAVFGGLMMVGLFALLVQMLKTRGEESNWLQAGSVFMVSLLLLVQVFTPYVNHPIGIGMLLIAFLLTPPPAAREVQKFTTEKVKKKMVFEPVQVFN